MDNNFAENQSKNNYNDILQRIAYLENNLEVIMKSAGEHHQSKFLDPTPSISIQPKSEVLIKPGAYLKMAAHATKYANHLIPKENWVEVIGLLTGKVSNKDTPLESIIVNDYWPIGIGDAVSVNIMDAEPVMRVFEKKKPDEFIVGWAHSHPSYTPFLSEDDLATQLRYQALWKGSVALVVDPEMITSTNQGFSVFRVTENRDEYYEISSEVDGMSTEASFEALEVIQKKLKTITSSSNDEFNKI